MEAQTQALAGAARLSAPGDIAVVGMACRFPHAKDLNSLWRVVHTGEVTFEDIGDERWKHSAFFSSDVRAVDKTYVKKGAFVEGVDEFAALHFGLAPRRVQVMDPQHRLLVETVRQALQDAGYEKKSLDRANTGVFIGASVSEYKDVLTSRLRAASMVDGTFGDALSPAEADAVRAAVADVVPTRAFSIAGSLLNMMAASVSQVFDLGGPSFTLDAACSSALVAIHEAVVHLRARQCHVALAGGVYLNLTPDNLVGFARIGAVSPSGVCRPFDARADGFVMGEGVGVVALKRLDDARRDGDRIYAVIRGSGCNNDGRGEGPMTPRPGGQLDAMVRAHADAGDLPIESIGFVETHGTATAVGDVVEVGALKSFFNQRAGHELSQPYCYLSSIKANIGHTMSAAGVAGFIKTALVLHHKTIVPQPAIEELNPRLELHHSPFKIAQAPVAWPQPAGHPRRAAVSSFGFGGTNAHVVMEEAPPLAAVTEERDELFVVSAPTQALLRKHLLEVATAIDEHQLGPSAVAHTLASRTAFPVRVAFVAQGREQVVAKLRQLALTESGTQAPEVAPKLAFLIPGQGAQRVGLLQDLVERFPSLRRRLEVLDRAAAAEAGCSLLDALYPRAPYSPEAAQRHLTQTQVCQPAMAALGVAVAELLSSVGLKPDLLVGHSLGEFAAAAVAGMLSGEDAVKLVARRGALMNGLPLKDCGTMLAVMAAREAVEPLLTGLAGVWLANHNHPTQVVLSGTTAGIAAARQKVEASGLKATALDVSHAFHSPLLAGVDAQLRTVLAAQAVHAPTIPVVSCITGLTYGSADEAKQVWERHATAPVEFVRALDTVASRGEHLYLQLGAGNALLSFARGVVAQSAGFFATDGERTLLDTLGQLFLRGVALDARALTPVAERTLVTLPPTPLETQKYWAVERTQRVAHTPLDARPSPKTAPTGAAMDTLVALFREQMTLLQGQQDILKAQASALQALAGVQVPGAVAALPAPAATVAAPSSTEVKPPNFSNLVAQKPAPAARPAPAAAAKVDLGPEVQSRVMASVARISAFPQTTLKLEQSLTGELGFDSLMLVELDADIGKAWPTLGGLPRELFTPKTTVADVVNHVVKALAAPKAEATAASPVSTAPVEQYAPVVSPTPLRSVRESVLTFDAPLLVTRDGRGLAEAVAAELQRRGIKAQVGAADTAGTFAGVVHLAGLDAQGDVKAPARALLSLAQRLGERAELLVTVTGLGGHFGFDRAPGAKLGQVGALGFTKALAAEWPQAIVKAIDVDPSLPAAQLAGWLVDELFSADRSAEVGFGAQGRLTVSLKAAPAAAPARPLTADSVVLVTGGAKGLGLAFARSLAKQYGSTLVLAGRSAADAEVTAAVASVKAAGARACSYQVLDTRDEASVARTVQRIGRVDAVVHAAGVLADALVGKKQSAELDAVIETKVSGAQALLQATRGSLQLAVFIGSWAGRFGNAAQTDYSAANEMLARLAVGQPFRAVAIDFPPFEDSAMGQKIPSFLKAEMKAAGVTFLSTDEGAAALLQAVAQSTGEVLVGRAVPERLVQARADFPVSRLNHVYLNDHEMAGQHVLPLAAAVDHVAAAALEATGRTGAFTISDFKLKRPVLVPDTTWLEVTVKAALRNGQCGDAEVSLSQGAALAYRGVVGAAKDVSGVNTSKVTGGGPLPMSLREFYDGFTFHGPRLQGILSLDAVSEQGITGTVKGCRPADWVKEPLRAQWAVDPLIIDSSFQLAGYWAWVKHQRAGFPLGFREFTLLKPFGTGPVSCTARFEAVEGDVFRGTLVWHDTNGELLAVMQGAEAEFKQRDPQFTVKGKSATEPAAVASTGLAPDVSTYDFSRFPEYEELQERLQMAEAFGLKNPYFSLHERIANDTTQVNGKEMINFSSYNYVGNSGHPEVSAAAKAAIDQYGTTVSASRVASGERPLHAELEQGLARFFGTEASLVFTAGHSTNVTVIGHIVGPNDLILHDALAHDSIIQGAKLSGAKRRPFPHNDWEALDRTLAQLRPHYRRVLVCIEGTYSMDGDIPDLPKFIEVKKRHHALLLVDEAHSAGVVGKTGRGVGEYHQVDRSDVDLWMGTLSKSFASCGGYIGGTRALIEYLKYTTPGFVYSVGISPPNAAAALASLKQIEAHPERPQRAQTQAKKFIALLKARGIDTGLSKDSPVVPAIIGNSVLCLQLSDRLKDRGINVQPILYPAVEESAARLRFFMCSTHTDEQLAKTAEVLATELEALKQEQAA